MKIIQKKTIFLYLLPLFLIIATLLVYYKSADYAVIGGDDERLALQLNNQYASSDAVKKIFTNKIYPDTSERFYRPLLTLSFYFDSKISGTKFSLSVSHTVNIFLHIISTLLLFHLLKKYYFPPPKAFIASLIFAVHPVIAETTVWLAGRNDSMLFIFVIISFMCFIDYNESKKHYFLIIHLVAYALALLVKESAIVLPLLCLCYMFIKKYPKKVKLCIYWSAITASYLGLRFLMSGFHDTWAHIFRFEDFVINLNMVFDYITTAFLVSNITTFTAVKVSIFIKGIAIIALLMFLSIRSRNRKYILFFLLWTVLFLVPNFFVERSHFQGNRMYVPLAGLITCVFFMLGNNIKTNAKKYITLTVLIMFISVCAFKTKHRIAHFQNPVSFWKHEKNTGDSPWISQQYAIALAKSGQYQESIKEFESLIYKKNYATKENISNLSIVYRLSGNNEKAESILQEHNLLSEQN